MNNAAPFFFFLDQLLADHNRLDQQDIVIGQQMSNLVTNRRQRTVLDFNQPVVTDDIDAVAL